MNYKNKNELKQAFYSKTGQFWKGYIDTESYVNPYYVEWLENLLIAASPTEAKE